MFKAVGNSEVTTFSDSDLASCEKTRARRSVACIFFNLDKQNHVSRSTTSAEFYALLEGITDGELLKHVIYFAYKVEKRIFNWKHSPMFCENSATGKIASSTECIARTKHIDVGHLWIQEVVAEERIKVHYVNSDDQGADIFNKTLVRALFEKFEKRIGMISS